MKTQLLFHNSSWAVNFCISQFGNFYIKFQFFPLYVIFWYILFLLQFKIKVWLNKSGNLKFRKINSVRVPLDCTISNMKPKIVIQSNRSTFRSHTQTIHKIFTNIYKVNNFKSKCEEKFIHHHPNPIAIHTSFKSQRHRYLVSDRLYKVFFKKR